MKNSKNRTGRARVLTQHTWAAFCAGTTTSDLWDDAAHGAYDWRLLMGSDHADVALGAVLLWL